MRRVELPALRPAAKRNTKLLQRLITEASTIVGAFFLSKLFEVGSGEFEKGAERKIGGAPFGK